MLKYFFYNWKDIPSGYEWSAYDMGYWTWIGILALISIVVCILYKKSNDQRRDTIRKGIAILIIVQEILKDILHYLAGSITLEHLPLHLCGVSIFFIAWHAFSPNKINREYLYCLSLPGALLALMFPNWTEYPILHFSSFNSFTMHTWLVLYTVMLLYSKELQPKFKDLKYTFVIILIYMIPIYFLNKVWDTNFFFLNTPSEGSPLVPLYAIFGEGYVIALVVLFLLLWLLMYLPWMIKEKK